MPAYLAVTIRFLDPEPSFHGRRDGGEWEWPPSPLRLLQALTAAAAYRWPGRRFEDDVIPALAWFERLAPPVIVAPAYHVGTAVRIAVPNNDMDVPATAWAAGNEPVKPHRPVDLKTMKTVQPVWVRGRPEELAVHYLFALPADAPESALDVIRTAARSVTHLGWGVDMAVGDAAVITADEADALPGERWRPARDAATTLRVPRPGTLDALRKRHAAFLGRLDGGGFKPVPPLTAFDTVGYRRDTDPVGRAVAAFELRTVADLGRFQPYHAGRRTAAVAGMVRHATAALARATQPLGWTEQQLLAVVHGHGPDGQTPLRGADADERFAFLPLPSVEYRPGGETVGGVRRVLVVAPPGQPAAAQWARALSGTELTPLAGDDTRPAALRLVERPEADPVVRRYLAPARVWTTVTPVLRPGFDDRDREKAEKLLRKAFADGGLPPPAELQWRGGGFRAGVDLAQRFEPPETLKGYVRLHVRVTWPTPVPGPVAVGAGRYRGFGLFVADA